MYDTARWPISSREQWLDPDYALVPPVGVYPCCNEDIYEGDYIYPCADGQDRCESCFEDYVEQTRRDAEGLCEHCGKDFSDVDDYRYLGVDGEWLCDDCFREEVMDRRRCAGGDD